MAEADGAASRAEPHDTVVARTHSYNTEARTEHQMPDLGLAGHPQRGICIVVHGAASMGCPFAA